MALIYAAKEPRTRRRFWSLPRRVRRAVREMLLGLPEDAQIASEVEVILQTGERFKVILDGRRVVSILRQERGA